MKVAHLVVVRKLTQGQVKQLQYEVAASAEIRDMSWQTVAFHNFVSDENFVQTIPWFFRPMFLRCFFGWIIALKLSRTNDFLLMRHMTFDPFAFFFTPFIHNRISVHHAKEVSELRLIRKGWRGFLASMLERFSGRCAVNNALAVLGVTNDIAEYERSTHAPKKTIGVYANGVDSNSIVLLEDERVENSINVGFICGSFSAWHGLDKLLVALDRLKLEFLSHKFSIHLIGALSDHQKKEIQATEERRQVVKAHGPMLEAEYRTILACCDVGVASLAMERQGLSEGSTLKVREMLAMGLAVYSGHRDIALDEAEPFVKVVDSVSIHQLIDFSMATKNVSRNFIRDNSLHRIEKSNAMRNAIAQVIGSVA